MELLGYMCNLLFVVGALLLYDILPSIAIISPLFFKIFFRVFMRRTVNNQCSSFSELVGPRQIRCVVAAVTSTAIGFAALKLDGILDVEWTSVLWPIWAFIALLFVMSTGVFLLFMGALCTWAVNEAEAIEVLATAWLCYSVIGANICLVIVVSELIRYLHGLDEGILEVLSPSIYLVHGYLIIFICLTVCSQAKIA